MFRKGKDKKIFSLKRKLFKNDKGGGVQVSPLEDTVDAGRKNSVWKSLRININKLQKSSTTRQRKIICALTTLSQGILKWHAISWVLEVAPTMPRRLESLLDRYTSFNDCL